MNLEYLFSNFPFLSDERMTLSKLFITDEEYLQEILDDNNLDHGSEYHIQTADRAFDAKLYVELGYYKKEEPNLLLGSISINDIDPQTESVRIDIIPNFSDVQSAIYALSTVLDFLFENIEVKRVYVKRIISNKLLDKIFMSNGFLLEGVLRRCVLDPKTKEVNDMHVFGKLSEEHIKTKGEATEDLIVAFDETNG